MNVGANTMTLAAQKIGMTIIPEGKCTFPVRIIRNYRPTGIVGSVFKLLRLAKRMKSEGINPQESSIKRLIAGGESFQKNLAHSLKKCGVCLYTTHTEVPKAPCVVNVSRRQDSMSRGVYCSFRYI